MKLSIIVFRNNLRIDDNYPLYNACKDSEYVLGLYSLENLQGEIYNFKKCDVFREKFIKESLLNLKENLSYYGINLSVVNSISEALKLLDSKYDITIYFDKEVGSEELEFENILKQYNYKSYFTQTMITPFEFDYKKSFSHFRKKAEKQEIKEPLGKIETKKSVEFETLDIQIPNIKIENPHAIVFKGGETEALKQLQNYLPKIHEYKTTRNEMSGFENSTKFSPYLAMGCISPRRIYHEIKKQEKITYESESSYWIYFELLWRDFFHLVMKYSQNKLFLKSGIKDKKYNFREDKKLFRDFFSANTGLDLIDSSINELRSTGWLSNRNRQIVASYFVKNLGLDWRVGAAFFESFLVDYNPASNYGNWAYQAYVGNDTSYRLFDVKKQSNMYNGSEYINKWLVEKSNKKIDYISMAETVKSEVFFED
ncbi:deoxyribodipyrimidine photo-lyase [Malaciobacter pacificus]|uniref:Cryptochrome DASH n=1 Tax=Malaciobacter pacificus TaxID=1080223 RepID=A0A5C2HFL2_9BACT|nr:DASH family cryptochrome [Malaciobacter pacificus]QEP35624.1 cryptochrome, DASH family [Malaciobacter pacificus]GGD46230.1 deoxyribodipyrimidine photo-lyase [Malaciobacter pacificus]